MTTVKQLKAYLDTLPDETVVSVLKATCVGYSTVVEEVDLDFKENVEFTDLTGNQFVKKGDPIFNKKYLTFGEEVV